MINSNIILALIWSFHGFLLWWYNQWPILNYKVSRSRYNDVLYLKGKRHEKRSSHLPLSFMIYELIVSWYFQALNLHSNYHDTFKGKTLNTIASHKRKSLFYNSLWLLLTLDDSWWLLMTLDDSWWLLMTTDDYWWLI